MTDISLGLWLSHSKKPVRLINAPEAFVRAGDGKACIRKPEALVCCHGSMGPICSAVATALGQRCLPLRRR